VPDPSDPGFRFARAWAEARPAVEGYLAAVVRDRHAVDDLVQEVALAAWTGFAAYTADRPFLGWALGIARHKLHDRWRDLARGRLAVADPGLIEALAVIADDEEDDLAQRRRALRDCLSGIRGRAWDVLQAVHAAGEAPMDIARRLGLSAANVRVILHRARTALRSCVERRLAGGGHG
jgi:RNA polymerase sigma-70 factor (ECF subfamily)